MMGMAGLGTGRVIDHLIVKWSVRTDTRQLHGMAREVDMVRRGIEQASRIMLDVGFVGAGAFAIVTRSAIRADKSFRMLKAAIGASGKELNLLRDSAFDISADIPALVHEIGGAQKQYGKMGATTSEILSDMESIAKAAFASDTPIASVAKYAMNIRNIFEEDVGSALDMMLRVENRSPATLEKLGRSLRYAGTSAKLAGLDFASYLGFLGGMAGAGRDVDSAAQGLNQMFGRLAKASNQIGRGGPMLKKAFNQVGIGLDNVIATWRRDPKEGGGLYGVFELIAAANLTMEDQLALFDALGGARYAASLAYTVQNMPKVRALRQEAMMAEGEVDRQVSEITKGMFGAWTKLVSAWDRFVLKLSESGIGGTFILLAKGARLFLLALSESKVALAGITGIIGIAIATGFLGLFKFLASRFLWFMNFALLADSRRLARRAMGMKEGWGQKIRNWMYDLFLLGSITNRRRRAEGPKVVKDRTHKQGRTILGRFGKREYQVFNPSQGGTRGFATRITRREQQAWHTPAGIKIRKREGLGPNEYPKWDSKMGQKLRKKLRWESPKPIKESDMWDTPEGKAFIRKRSLIKPQEGEPLQHLMRTTKGDAMPAAWLKHASKTKEGRRVISDVREREKREAIALDKKMAEKTKRQSMESLSAGQHTTWKEHDEGQKVLRGETPTPRERIGQWWGMGMNWAMNIWGAQTFIQLVRQVPDVVRKAGRVMSWFGRGGRWVLGLAGAFKFLAPIAVTLKAALVGIGTALVALSPPGWVIASVVALAAAVGLLVTYSKELRQWWGEWNPSRTIGKAMMGVQRMGEGAYTPASKELRQWWGEWNPSRTIGKAMMGVQRMGEGAYTPVTGPNAIGGSRQISIGEISVNAPGGDPDVIAARLADSITSEMNDRFLNISENVRSPVLR